MPSTTPKRPRAGTQLAVILALLEEAAPHPVGLDRLMRIARCGAVHSAMAKLRSRGFAIRNLQRIDPKTGQRFSSYQLHLDEGGQA